MPFNYLLLSLPLFFLMIPYGTLTNCINIYMYIYICIYKAPQYREGGYPGILWRGLWRGLTPLLGRPLRVKRREKVWKGVESFEKVWKGLKRMKRMKRMKTPHIDSVPLSVLLSVQRPSQQRGCQHASNTLQTRLNRVQAGFKQASN